MISLHNFWCTLYTSLHLYSFSMSFSNYPFNMSFVLFFNTSPFPFPFNHHILFNYPLSYPGIWLLMFFLAGIDVISFWLSIWSHPMMTDLSFLKSPPVALWRDMIASIMLENILCWTRSCWLCIWRQISDINVSWIYRT